MESGAFGEAEARLDALLADARMPGDRAFYQNKRGIARIGLGRRDQALDDFHGALASVEGYPPALTNVGNLLFEDGAIDDAIAHYEAAILRDDGYAVAHRNLGIALKRSGRIDEGVRSLRRAGRLEGGIFGTPRKKR